jgi:hypothetical protein
VTPTKPGVPRTEDEIVRTPLGETVLESIGEIAVRAVICLVGGVFIFMWGKHPALLIVGIAMFAVAGG